jgi:hypothetical protein
MTEKLEKLITLAVADGEISERELEILKKKATEEGVDEDELEMLLKTRLWERKEVMKAEIKNSIPIPPADNPKSNKEGDLKKCPSCGAPVESFTSNCKECGHEFRNVNSNQSLNKLFEQLKKTPISQHPSLISNFPIPNTKEDLIEFIVLCINNSTPLDKMQTGMLMQADGMLGMLNGQKKLVEQKELMRAWINKGQNAIDKARLLETNDSILNKNLQNWTNQLSKNASSDKNKMRMTFLIGIPLFIILLYSVISFEQNQNQEYKDGIKNEKSRLETVVNSINIAVSKKDFQTALVLTSQLKWEYSDGVKRNEIKNLEKTWDEKRDKMIKTINELKK